MKTPVFHGENSSRRDCAVVEKKRPRKRVNAFRGLTITSTLGGAGLADSQHICRFSGCEKTIHANGLCQTHNHAAWRARPDNGLGRGRRSPKMEFVRQAAETKTDACVEWPFATNAQGYGYVSDGGGTRSATQVVLELSGSPRPTSRHFALHAPVVCNNRKCVNPKHLRWGTAQENSNDRSLDGTLPRGERISKKLNSSQVLEILRSEESARKMADRFGVSVGTVRCIRQGRSWSWISEAIGA